MKLLIFKVSLGTLFYIQLWNSSRSWPWNSFWDLIAVTFKPRLEVPLSSLRVPIVTLHGVLLGTPLVDIIEASFKIGLGSSFRAAL